MTDAQRYEILGRVATTRSGAVWKARDIALDRLVALKEIDVADREALHREASAIAALRNEHIVEVYGVEEDGAAAYLVEEWVDGATLAAVIRANGTMPPAQALSVVRGALLGLDAAHRAGLVHGDVSMSNILVDATGRARLIDFGSVAPVGAAAQPSTGAFAAPEVLAGWTVTPAADVYAAAGVVATLLHGRLERAPSTKGIAGPIKDVLDRALDPAYDRRYANAGAFLAALEAAAHATYGLSWWSQAGLGAAATASIAALVPIGAAISGTATVAGAGEASTGVGAGEAGAGAGAGGEAATAVAFAGGAAFEEDASRAAPASRVGGRIAWHSRRLWLIIGASAAVAAAAGTVFAISNSHSTPRAGSTTPTLSTSSSAPVSASSAPSSTSLRPSTASFLITIGYRVSPGHPSAGAGTVAAGQTQDYTFSGTKGAVVYFQGGSAPCTVGTARYEVVRPGGAATNWSSDSCSSIGRKTLDVSGTWTVRVGGESGGSFSFVVRAVASPNLIALGDTRSGTITKAGQRDVYLLRGMTAGQVIYLAGANSASCASGNVDVALLRPDGTTPLASDTCNNAGRFVLDAAGTWQIVASGDGNGTRLGAYTFTILGVTDQTIGTAIGQTGVGTLSAIGAFDNYRFSAQAGQSIYLEGANSTSCTPGLVDYTLLLPDGSSAQFGSDTCRNAGRYAIKTTGTWTVRIYGSNKLHSTGPYRFHIYAVSDATTAIAIGQSAKGTLGVGAVHNYLFTAKTGEVIYLEGANATSCATGRVDYALFKPGGSPANVGADTCGNAGRYMVAGNGTWTLQFYGADSGHGSGAYRFEIFAVTDQNFTIGIGEVAQGQLAGPGEFDNFAFTGTAGQVITVAGNTSPGCVKGTVEFELLLPNGTSAHYGADACSSAGKFTLPTSGTFTLRVFGGSNGLDTGAYQLTLQIG